MSNYVGCEAHLDKLKKEVVTMPYGATAGGAVGASSAAHAAAIANAIKASGAIVRMEPLEFDAILAKCPAPLLVHAAGSWFSRSHKYLTNYKGLHFYTESPHELVLPQGTEVIEARKIWIPA